MVSVSDSDTSCRGIEDYRDATIDATPIRFHFQPSPFSNCDGTKYASFIPLQPPWLIRFMVPVDRLHSSASALHTYIGPHHKTSSADSSRPKAIRAGYYGFSTEEAEMICFEAVNSSGMEASSKRLPSTSLLPSLKVPTSTVDVRRSPLTSFHAKH
ncbi:hypothetical protein BXZ70DRAFT_669378 [Cristinia sonorae]|uniref:Uncharacterized protein n=1 Tax=Cristinia sonorae TaxID=1940300 RepID=A0A8K0UUS6_9AGAR|nr:hypothetical protein BXZ70DRAFT_669378 [Cristinia sonorae]